MTKFVMMVSLDMPYVDSENRNDLLVQALSESLERVKNGSEYGAIIGKKDDTIGMFEIREGKFDPDTYNE